MTIKEGVVVNSDDVIYDLINGKLKPGELLLNQVEIDIVESSLQNIRRLVDSLEKAELVVKGSELYF